MRRFTHSYANFCPVSRLFLTSHELPLHPGQVQPTREPTRTLSSLPRALSLFLPQLLPSPSHSLFCLTLSLLPLSRSFSVSLFPSLYLLYCISLSFPLSHSTQHVSPSFLLAHSLPLSPQNLGTTGSARDRDFLWNPIEKKKEKSNWKRTEQGPLDLRDFRTETDIKHAPLFYLHALKSFMETRSLRRPPHFS